ncbi:diguanylate cyclase (GGDEF)-like protein [Pseudoduganella flava]|uniref:diguanylate cyclase n=1 Tax=Pseudoduganella flava TaxID=871742 RepID=A0A562PQJ3_9BURK|nr:GGDEF domain-containing protein [Pseudoduganella flava]QGZ37881.1 diguanylate cyclase [Pseudoduganella flava]TWI46714.1 diguanylate cyclase (GGDEF)-like protein [Pseudoduganella flava]
MNTYQRHAIVAACLAGTACLLLYATAGTAKPFAIWHWMDIAGEGGTAVMAFLWCLIVLGSRPDGRVTRLLAGGLAAICVGSWADCMDEFWRIDKAALWDNALEALMPLGMAVLTAGLYYWRQEQASLTEHLKKRERLFRDHRAFDRVTQLADARYLRAQLERERQHGPCALVLLDIDGFHRVNREHGQAEGDRVLQAVSHMLLLNLRNDDLLCRYAGDRFAVLMPGLSEAAARDVARHLCVMVAMMRHHAGGVPLTLTLRHSCGALGASAGAGTAAPDTLLAELCRQMDAA